jgi:hypothetical protein
MKRKEMATKPPYNLMKDLGSVSYPKDLSSMMPQSSKSGIKYSIMQVKGFS